MRAGRILFCFRLILLLWPVLCSVGVAAQGSWQKIPVPTGQYLKSVCFVDSLCGWIAGDSGVILHTTDGGNSWTLQNTHGTHEVEDVFFLDRNQGWASLLNFTEPPYGTILLKTTDGGANWVSQPYPDENIFITCILYRDSLNGWMGGRPHALVRTSDGGSTWTQAAIDTSTLAFFPVLCIKFYNDHYGYAGGGMFDIAGVTWHTSDGGDHWQAIQPSQAPADEVHGLHLFDSIRVMGAGGDPDFGYGVGLLRTSDGGANWTYEELGIQGNAYDLDFRNESEVWAPLGPRRLMIYSLDGGSTWTDLPAPGNSAIYDVTFPDTLHGYAVGKEGAFLRYIPPVIPSVSSMTETGYGFVLHQNRPNPAGMTTLIPWRLVAGRPDERFVLRVSDLPGRDLLSLDLGNPGAGEHAVPLDLSGMESGIYLYRIEKHRSGESGISAPPRRLVVVR